MKNHDDDIVQAEARSDGSEPGPSAAINARYEIAPSLPPTLAEGKKCPHNPTSPLDPGVPMVLLLGDDVIVQLREHHGAPWGPRSRNNTNFQGWDKKCKNNTILPGEGTVTIRHVDDDIGQRVHVLGNDNSLEKLC